MHFKTFENFETNPKSKFALIVDQEIASASKFMVSHMPSIIGMAMNKSGSKELTQDMVDGFKDAVNDHVFGGVEPEDWPEAWYSFWDSLGLDSFLYANETVRLQIMRDLGKTWGIFGGSCPYQDKSHPYMSWSVEADAKFKADYSSIRDMLLGVEY